MKTKKCGKYTGPKTATVGQITVRIKQETLDDNKYGDTDFTKGEVRLADIITNPDMLRITLIHELLHVAESNNTGLKMLSEKHIDHFASMVLSLIRNNHKLIKWVQDGT